MAAKYPPELLEEKLTRALKAKAVLTERSRQLQQQIEDFRKREDVMGHVTTELVERQRELNFMLHRASSVLHQLQDTNLALSAEFTQLVKELPAPKEDTDWESTVTRVNELFKKTHELAGEMQDEIFGKMEDPDSLVKHGDASITASPEPPEPQTESPESEPEPAASCAADPETVCEQQDPVDAPVQAAAKETENAETPKAVPEDSRKDELIERLFNSMQCDASGRVITPIGDDTTSDNRKQGLLSRIFGLRDNEG